MYFSKHFVCSAVFYSQLWISAYWAAKCCAIPVYLSILKLSLRIQHLFFFFIEKSFRIREKSRREKSSLMFLVPLSIFIQLKSMGFYERSYILRKVVMSMSCASTLIANECRQEMKVCTWTGIHCPNMASCPDTRSQFISWVLCDIS